MSTFLGIGMGPIQTGIFLSGAFKGGFDRIVVADVDKSIVEALRADKGAVTVNIAGKDKVFQEKIPGVELLNPEDGGDREKLVEIASEADEIATALPGVKFFRNIAPWLKEGFDKNPGRRRFIYAAENHNHAAELLEKAVSGDFSHTFYLNTVIGKMSGVVPSAECAKRGLLPLSLSSDRGHLVEEFNRILIGECPHIGERRVLGLHVKKELLPFEEAKLYGHNAVHMLLGLHAADKNIGYMHELAVHPEIMHAGIIAFIWESGQALCRKWEGVDELFTGAGMLEYADGLLERMTNPFLKDSVDRICRDLERKLGWDDRLIGTMRMIERQGITPGKMAIAAKMASVRLFGTTENKIRAGFERIWTAPWDDEYERMLKLVLEKV
jgi:mannitol-1-phosphate 5-dehydrogenase